MYNLRNQAYEAYATIPNAFQAYELDILRDIIKNKAFKKHPGTVGSNITDTQIRDSRIDWIMTDNQSMQWVFQRLHELINEGNRYFGMELTQIEGIQLTEYDAEYTGFYGAHTDAGYGYSPSRTRKLSLSMQLSDPADYDGGELLLYVDSIKNSILASKQRGSMTMFRSHIIHEVTPVTRGTRYSLVTWVNGPLFT